MKYLRKFNSIEEMLAAITADEVGFIGMVHPEGEDPIMNIHVHEIIYPHDLVISCENNIVTITAEPVGEVTIEYRFNYEGEYVTYTGPFPITETVIVTARASAKDGSINRSQQCEYVALPTNLTITCENNTVTITADNATTIEYNFDGSSTYTTYTQPFAITQTVTVYAKASSSVGSITGSQQCEYVKPIDYSIPFYIEDISGSDNTVQIKKANNSAPTLAIEKSTDGTTWETMGTTSTTAITAAVPANGKLYLRCSKSAWSTSSNSNTINTTGNCNVGGNIMSLLYGADFKNRTVFPSGVKFIFFFLFTENTNLVNAENLVLPATTLTDFCYCSMFNGCTSLTTAPELPATTLTEACYASMFKGCTSLTTTPELPATTLAGYCYQNMFQGCTSLTTAPELPATTLAEACYYYMFRDCTSLTTAPELPATTLVNSCYYNMFYNCTNLNYIKCLATDISAYSCTNNWVNGVATTGTFVKDPNISTTTWGTGVNGIPEGWIVKDGGIALSQDLNVATIVMIELDESTGYYTINGGSQVSIGEGTTTIPITQAMDGQTLLVYGEFDGEATQETMTLDWVDYSPTITITETNNYVTINAPNADTIQYRLGSTGEYTDYTAPVYINEDTTIYVTATRTVSGVDYTSTASQEVEHVLIPPTNLVISCTNNFVSITATGAATLEYNLDGGSTYTTYTVPFFISQSGTVYAKATNSDGSITSSQAVTYVDYRPNITITETNNYVTINAPNADTIQYRLGSTGEYTNYTAPVYIASDTTIYVTATRTVSEVDYTSTASQEVEHESIPPTNLVISCVSNRVTITADNATMIEYNFDGSSTYTTYTQPFAITQTVTVYAKASNVDGSITGSQECVYSAVPFAENLVFYAPLTEGDLTDHISGKVGITDTQSSTGSSEYYATCSWNSTVGAYDMYSIGRNSYNDYSSPLRFDNLTLYTGEGTDNIANQGLTIYMEIYQTKYSGNSYAFMFAVDDANVSFSEQKHSYGNKAQSTYMTDGTCNFGIRRRECPATSSFHKCVATVTSSGTITWYMDGASKGTGSWGGNMKGNPTSCAVLQQTYNTSEQEAYIKDLRIYNRCLSASEVSQL